MDLFRQVCNYKGIEPGMNLYYTTQKDANLTGVNLRGAKLARAKLDNANLTGAELDGAIFDNTTMPDGSINNPATYEPARVWGIGHEVRGS